MTWVPKNRPENDDDENSCKDDDEKGNFVRIFDFFFESLKGAEICAAK